MNRTVPNIGSVDKHDEFWECVSDLLTLPDEAGTVQVAGLPSVKELRSLVVIENRRAAAGLVRRQFGTGGPRRTIMAGAAAALILSGAASKLRTVRFNVTAARPGLQYHAWLRATIPADAGVGAILLGPPRANRKPVVLLTDGRGHLMAVAKFGVNRVTRPLVTHEAKALQEIGAVLSGNVHVPRLMASGEVGNGQVLLMGPLPAAIPGLRPTREALIETVRSVGAIDGRPGADLRDVASHPRLISLRHRIDEVAQCCVGIEVGSYHGDLHPGNVAVADDGRLILWDWERWGYGAPVGFDLLHHDLQSWIHWDGMAPLEAATALVARAPEILSPLGVPHLAATAVARDYLIRLGARYAADEQDRAGSALGAIEEWLFPAVLG